MGGGGGLGQAGNTGKPRAVALCHRCCILIFDARLGGKPPRRTAKLAAHSALIMSSTYFFKYTGLTYFRRSNAFSPSGIDGQTKAEITFFFASNGLKRK